MSLKFVLYFSSSILNLGKRCFYVLSNHSVMFKIISKSLFKVSIVIDPKSITNLDYCCAGIVHIVSGLQNCTNTKEVFSFKLQAKPNYTNEKKTARLVEQSVLT